MAAVSANPAQVHEKAENCKHFDEYWHESVIEIQTDLE
jgi:hypothetical protein